MLYQFYKLDIAINQQNSFILDRKMFLLSKIKECTLLSKSNLHRYNKSKFQIPAVDE
ncbi:hypothetical protein GQ55_9G481500 [Panicum hallii var. hallii]|uniref:Uncharacterized protein n=1 Tax=Panicum hallii var. hallii TaxID=1504633 RepID=A0A2T7CCU5_9POAL|nr:hypothetical protein GQ55_9G481500 [Panicum hallii var. hallii]